MDGSKLYFFKLLSAASLSTSLDVEDMDLSDTQLIKVSALTRCNLSNSLMPMNFNTSVVITDCIGNGMEFICDETNAPTIHNSSLQNCTFIVKDSSKVFTAFNNVNLTNSVFQPKSVLTGTGLAAYSLATFGNSNNKSKLQNCTFNQIGFVLDGTGVMFDTIFTNSIFNSCYFLIQENGIGVNTSFLSCNFNNTWFQSYTAGFPYTDYTGSNFNNCNLQYFSQNIIEGCKFINCSNKTAAQLVANAHQIVGRSYNFTYNGATYTVPAA